MVISILLFFAFLVDWFKPRFILPIKLGRITSRYGETKGRTKPHNGIDIAPIVAGTLNEPLLASADGTVSKIAYDSENGNYIQISHALGYLTGYAHLNSYAVKIGDKVKQGQKIGIVGKTGSATGVHVHFVVKFMGKNVDPESVIK